LHEVFDGHEEGSGDSFVSSSSEFIVLFEVHVKMLFEDLVSNEPHSADRALELDGFIYLSNDMFIGSIGKVWLLREGNI
jgi:hypothetical protein